MKYHKDQEKEIKSFLEKQCCVRCSSNKELTLDHVVPIRFLLQDLGATVDETYDWDNFQPLCRRCNQLKGGRFDLSDKRTKTLLIKYINRYCI